VTVPGTYPDERATTVSRWISFDCYGTLIDWRTGMLECFAAVAGVELALPLLERYHQHEVQLQSTPSFLSYRRVLEGAFQRAGEQLGLRLSGEQVKELPNSIARWRAFDEVPSTLRALAEEGFGLAVLSNIDDDLIAGSLPKLGVLIDLVITSEQVGAYKPDHAHFNAFLSRANPDAAGWTHVGCSYWHDIEPCTDLGGVGIMVNRDGEPGPIDRASLVVSDLRDLPHVLTNAR
jgi:2-haloacid dehalogenase